MKRIALFLFFLNFISCGKDSIPPEGFTKVIYTGENHQEKANLTKGVMIYARNINLPKIGSKFASNLGSFSTSNEVFFPNGAYKFFAIGYDSMTTVAAISADFFCGEGNNGEVVTLSGGTKAVNIVLGNTGASNSSICGDEFAGPNHRNGTAIKNLKVRLCAIGSVAPGCTVPSNTSVRIVIGEHDSIFNGPFFNFTNSIKSCHGINSPAPVILNDHFPMRMPFRFKLESFSGVQDCSGAPVRSILFEGGIEGTSSNPDRFIDNSNSTFVEIGIGV